MSSISGPVAEENGFVKAIKTLFQFLAWLFRKTGQLLGWLLKRAAFLLGWVTRKIITFVRWVGNKVSDTFNWLKKSVGKMFKKKRKGWYFGPIGFNLVFRPIASIIGGSFISTLFWLSLEATKRFGMIAVNPLDLTLWSLLTLALVIWIIMPDNDTPEKVPEAHAAMVTFLGARWRLYRTEGEYSWTGKSLFLGRSMKISEPGTNDKGFIYLGEIPIRIWNAADANGQDKVNIVSVARDTSAVTTTLTIVLELDDPKLWLDSQDALGDVAERARSAFRTAISFFVGTDVTGVKSVLGLLMAEKTIVTAFLQRTIGTNIVHSLLEDRSGVHQYLIVGQDKNGKEIIDEMIDEDNGRFLADTINNAKQRFLADIKSREAEFDKEMWDAALDANQNGIVAADRSVSEALTEVAKAVGADFLRASVGNISLSAEVTKEANKAASEVFQRDAQMASAKTVKEARKILSPSKEELENNPYFQDAAMVAAAQDNPNISVVHVTGSGDRLTRAAAVHANQSKKGT